MARYWRKNRTIHPFVQPPNSRCTNALLAFIFNTNDAVEFLRDRQNRERFDIFLQLMSYNSWYTINSCNKDEFK